ncbi:hypothetical protein CLV63_11313 [Murinocardiopsis flavida]|uniref:Uncharacterized protein n=1 Tax=Murinocardiopsis flavida TaxID=645275 RepID=A0A2P8DF67_9ACTN|nr:hypothetical protein [Murinocardiopsis flavida]PSK95850.1 hypothetical protein CLV63_11313 [Murinocardiopsis flavida]
MTGWASRYGAPPWHLAVMVCCFALALYAGWRLVQGDPVGVALWFVGAALLHDLVLLPAYTALDRGARAAARRVRGVRRPGGAAGRERGTGNGPPPAGHLRVPATVSGVLFLVWAPLILGPAPAYERTTGLPPDGFGTRWVLITAALFAASAALYAARRAIAGRRRRHGRT